MAYRSPSTIDHAKFIQFFFNFPAIRQLKKSCFIDPISCLKSVIPFHGQFYSEHIIILQTIDLSSYNTGWPPICPIRGIWASKRLIAENFRESRLFHRSIESVHEKCIINYRKARKSRNCGKFPEFNDILSCFILLDNDWKP